MKILISCLDSCKYYVITLLTIIFLEVALSNLKANPEPLPRPLIKPRHPTVQIAFEKKANLDFGGLSTFATGSFRQRII